MMSENSSKEDAVKQLASEFKVDKYSQFRSDKSTKQIIKDIYDAVIYIKNDKEYKEKRNEWDVASALKTLFTILCNRHFIFLRCLSLLEKVLSRSLQWPDPHGAFLPVQRFPARLNHY